MDLYEAIFQSAKLGIVISNAEGIIERVNPFANQLFGYEGEELVGKKVEVLLPEELRERHVAHRQDFNAHPKARAMGSGMDLAARRKDGTLFPVEVSLAPYERLGKREIVSFVSDITERKRTADALKALNAELERKVGERTQELSQAFLELRQSNLNLREEMEQRKKAERVVQEALERERELGELKSRFVATASHEFRTPLSAILSSAALLSRYRAPEDAEKRERHIQTIKAAVQNLNGILNDFLSLEKIEQGRVEYRLSRFSLAALARELVGEMQALAKSGQRIHHRHRGEDEPVFLEKTLLRGILLNLLSNAVKYSPEEKEICLCTEIGDSEIRIVVEDHGIGIPASEQKHLFETFFRAKNTANIQGTGLGLNIVKHYLDMMGGVIQVESLENRGTTFKIFLPKTREPRL